MEVELLGPVVVRDGDGPVALDAPKERAVLIALALRPGQAVSVDDLLAAVWGDDPPASAPKTLQGYVSNLRHALGAERLLTGAASYTLDIEKSEVDEARFVDLVGAARDAVHADEFGLAEEFSSAAVRLWRGVPLADLADGPLRQGQSARLEELKLLAVETVIEARLGRGDHEAVIGELEALVADHPLHEPLWAKLMLALYRSGRQGEALRCYQRLRTILAEELGVEPNPEMQRLENRILRHDGRLSVDATPPATNLPGAVSSFVGRVDEVVRVGKLSDEHRLVTLIGPGGVGKTRLALEVARRRRHLHSDGVWWIDLASVTDPTTIPARLASVLGATAAPGMPAIDAVLTFLRRRQVLIVIDNCEHLVHDAAGIAEQMVAAGPGVSVLGTSRLPFGITGEYLYTVEPLAVPPLNADDDASILDFDAVRLFQDRSEERGGPSTGVADLAAVADICRRVDGLPLAIEIAAARSRHLSPTEMVQHLVDSGPLLDEDVASTDPRHRTLRATLDWSHGLLEDGDRRAFDRLAVFPGDFEREAFVAVVTTGEASEQPPTTRLDRLVDASMVSVITDAAGRRRFRLAETSRAYAAGHIEPAERDVAARRHADHFRRIARRAEAALDGPGEREHLEILTAEEHNLRSAIEWSLDRQERSVTLEFGPALGHALYVQGDIPGSRVLLERLLEGTEDAPVALRASVVYRLVWPTFLGGDPMEAFARQEQALELAREASNPTLESLALSARGHMVLLGLADVDEALRWDHLALEAAPEGVDSYARAWAQSMAGQALALGDRADRFDETDRHLRDAELTFADYPFGLAHVFMDRALLAAARGDIEALESAAATQIDHARAAGDHIYEQVGLVMVGAAHLLRGSQVDSADLLLAAARLALDTGNIFQLGVALQALAALAAAQGDALGAARLWGAGLAMAPLWDMFERLYAPFLDPARRAVDVDWPREVDSGRELSPADAVDLALRRLLA